MVLGIYGAGGLGREVYELALDVNAVKKQWDAFVFIDDAETLSGTEIYDVPVMPFASFQEKYGADAAEIAIAVGEPAIRTILRNKVKQGGYALAILVHPSTRLSRWAVLEEGAIITYGCNISCGTHVKTNAYLQPSCGLGHDTIVGEDSVVSACARIAGGVTVGERVYIGMSALLKEGITVGNDVIIGMASVVHKPIDDSLIVMGNPARPMRKNEDNRVFGSSHKA